MENKIESVHNVIHPHSNISLIIEWFLNKQHMSHKKIQKLSYYAQIWSLIALDTDIVPEGMEFQAWVHGPVNTEIYHRCKKFGWRDIMVADSDKAKSKNDIQTYLSESQKMILEHVFNSYGSLDADQLEFLTHQEEPWIRARGNCLPYENCNTVIDKKFMKEYYSEKYKDYLE